MQIDLQFLKRNVIPQIFYIKFIPNVVNKGIQERVVVIRKDDIIDIKKQQNYTFKMMDCKQ